MTPGLVGGILLIIGAFFVFRGQIFYSVFAYFIADIAWIMLAYSSGDLVGTALVSIGMLLGIGSYYKMHTGKMYKSLKKTQ